LSYLNILLLLKIFGESLYSFFYSTFVQFPKVFWISSINDDFVTFIKLVRLFIINKLKRYFINTIKCEISVISYLIPV